MFKKKNKIKMTVSYIIDGFYILDTGKILDVIEFTPIGDAIVNIAELTISISSKYFIKV